MKMNKNNLFQQSIRICFVVTLYWICSIGLVFLNKYLLSSKDLQLDAPIFLTWYQCIVSVLLCYICSCFSTMFPSYIQFPPIKFDYRISREVLPLSFAFVLMIATNSLCLKHVGVSFYYIGRSLTTVFNVVCSYVILGQTTSCRCILCCFLIIFGFTLGVDQENILGTLSVWGVFYGILASLFVAVNAILTQKTLHSVGHSIVLLTIYNSVNSVVIFIPFMILSGDLTEIAYFSMLTSAYFWFLITLSGFFGFLMSYVSGWQIQVTSPLSHNISGTAKAAVQTVIAVIFWNEFKSYLWWLSILIILLGSSAYTAIKHKEMKKTFNAYSGVAHLPDKEPLLMTAAEKQWTDRS